MPRPRFAAPAAGACCAMLIAACAAAPSGPGATGGSGTTGAPGTTGGPGATGRPPAPAVPAPGGSGPSSPAESVRWTVAPALVECTGVAPMWCLQYRDAPDGPWKRHYGRIEGFGFRPGDEVELAVRFEAVPRPPADAPSRRTLMVRELSRRTLTSEVLPAALSGSAWRLDAMPGSTVSIAGTRGAPTLRFEAPARAAGDSGVNRYGARVDAGEGWLRVSSPMVTRMAGPPEAMALEGEFLGRLQRAGHWRVAGDRLRLLDADGGELMSFGRTTPAAPVR